MLARTRIAVASGTAALLSRHRSVAELLSGGEALGGSADEEISNWSATHSAMPSLYFEPDSTDAVGQVIAFMHAAGQKLRVVGSALSPNGIGLSDGAMINMAQCSKILSVDPERRQVTVQAGARVSEVVEALRPHGLTLQNYASIAEQQIGGFVQVGAHGTGAAIPPVDEQVVSMRLITPALGEICLSEADNPRLFRLARVGLGALGVVSEVTLQCVPAHKLVQRVSVETRAGIAARHAELLQHQHMRYMWIPHTDTVVVVTCDPLGEGDGGGAPPPPVDEAWATEPLRELLLQRAPEQKAGASGMNFAQLRDALLELAPLDKSHVADVNRAEAAFWKRSQGARVDWSDRILGFECGGQQWVSEVALPCGAVGASDGRDLQYMTDLLALIEASDIPAPSPIEQRWSRRSASPMSPAHSAGEDDLHSWVGIIMYLPIDRPEARQAITDAFWDYNAVCRRQLWPKYDAHQHWAKIEPPADAAERAAVRRRLRDRFPVDEFNAARRELDPKNILSNRLLDALLEADP
mmetsp:Transcript_9296/g.29910  ORF Transcript_9296/g.29910 Transcript_9296/m.29910 type:complete len:524 (-) Transcript_9296:110-1681(-)